MTTVKNRAALLLWALLVLPCQLRAAAPPFDIDVKELDRSAPKPAAKAAAPAAPKAAASPFDIDVKELERGDKPAAGKAEKKAKKKEAPARAARTGQGRKAVAGEGDYVRYTVKPGDHVFKILVARFGLSNEAAEKLIPEIVRVNDIPNIKKLTVGSTLLIPTGGHRERVLHAAHPGRNHQDAREREAVAETKAPAQPAAPALAPKVPAPPAPVVALPAPAPAVQAPAAKAPVAAPPAPVAPPAAAAKATSAPAAPAVVPVPVPPPPAPVANTWICSVRDKDPARIVDTVLNALSLRWSKNRIIQSAEGASNAFSIRVDRYFEKNGVRYIVSVAESDPYTYTLLRLLESAGYRVLMVNQGDDLRVIGDKLLRLVGLTPDFGKHLIQGGKEESGFLVQQDDPEGRRVLITGEPADPKLKWTLPAGCAYR